MKKYEVKNTKIKGIFNTALAYLIKATIATIIIIAICYFIKLPSKACEVKETRFYYNNKQFRTGHIIYNNRMMLPLRTLSEQLGFKVDWDSNNKTISISKNEFFTQFRIRSKYIFRYGYDSIEMDVEPMIIDERTFVPIRYAAESLNAIVDYQEDSSSKKIFIRDGNNINSLN